MNAAEYDKLIVESRRRRDEITVKKRHDYATEDVLSNFKRMGEATVVLRLDELYRVRPALAEALKDHLLKIDRIINLTLSGKAPKNETKVDSWDDFANYGDLSYAADMEESEAGGSI